MPKQRRLSGGDSEFQKAIMRAMGKVRSQQRRGKDETRLDADSPSDQSTPPSSRTPALLRPPSTARAAVGAAVGATGDGNPSGADSPVVGSRPASPAALARFAAFGTAATLGWGAAERQRRRRESSERRLSRESSERRLSRESSETEVPSASAKEAAADKSRGNGAVPPSASAAARRIVERQLDRRLRYSREAFGTLEVTDGSSPRLRRKQRSSSLGNIFMTSTTITTPHLGNDSRAPETAPSLASAGACPQSAVAHRGLACVHGHSPLVQSFREEPLSSRGCEAWSLDGGCASSAASAAALTPAAAGHFVGDGDGGGGTDASAARCGALRSTVATGTLHAALPEAAVPAAAQESIERSALLTEIKTISDMMHDTPEVAKELGLDLELRERKQRWRLLSAAPFASPFASPCVSHDRAVPGTAPEGCTTALDDITVAGAAAASAHDSGGDYEAQRPPAGRPTEVEAV